MRNFKIKNIIKFLLTSFFVIFGIVFTFSIITELFNIKINHYRINNIFFVRHGTDFNLIEQPFSFPDECEMIPWGGCFARDILYNEEYIQKVENEYSGSGCYGTVKHRFKGTKRGYTEMTIDGTCHYKNMRYRIIVY